MPEVLSFLVEQAELDAQGAYSTFNMGSGYALYCRAGDGETIVGIAERLGLDGDARGASRGGSAAGDPRTRRGALRGSQLELSAG